MKNKDIDFAFVPHPLTGDLATKTGSNAIRQSVINLVRTNYYNRGFNVEVGSNLDAIMFENYDLLTSQQLKQNIDNVIRNFEPRVILEDVEVINIGPNEIKVTIYYTELNDADVKSLTIDLQRVR
jgi:phage baseplate assembly protein W